MSDWRDDKMPMPRPGVVGWLLVVIRGIPLILVVYGCLLLLLLVRMFERPLCGLDRPFSPYITQFVCRTALRILGIGYATKGKPMREAGAIVANHGSWFDVFPLNAAQRIYFVSKSEVAGWPGIGWLARATGTVFIARKGTESKLQQEVFEARLRAGHKLLFFPEGTSTDTLRVLPFKSTLFAAFFTHGLDRILHIQPVTVAYHGPEGADPRFYGWWGDMDFGPHLLMILSARKQGRVEVIFHDAVPVDGFENRKVLADYCERVVRASLPHGAI